jgi:hypothetical protein
MVEADAAGNLYAVELVPVNARGDGQCLPRLLTTSDPHGYSHPCADKVAHRHAGETLLGSGLDFDAQRR